ncbi:MAG: nicotinate-nucleotide adenylyltransferase [Chloroflexi bacterium]|nr:nicotinate-nucleotide adenylyltransferase [Chloroflexota bacterium]
MRSAEQQFIRPRRLGVLGGTFDPIHTAHLIVAEEVRVKFGLAKVLFIPTGMPYFKSDQGLSAAQDRLGMVRAAVASNPDFEASTIEIDRPGPTYTVDTVAELREKYRQEEIYFIVGWDALKTLPSWREPKRLLEMCRLVGVPRPDWRKPSIPELEEAIPGASQRIVLLDQPVIGISSTEIRSRVAAGISIRYLVPEAVERYIAERGLYCEG